MSLYNQFITWKAKSMWISLYVFLADFYGSASWFDNIPNGKNKFEDIKIMWEWATKLKSVEEVRKFMNTEAVEMLHIRSKL